MYSSSAKCSARGKNRMLNPSRPPEPFITQNVYSGARTIEQIQSSGFRSRAAIDTA